MKTTKAPSRLATSDKEIARLLGSLEEDAPARGADAAILARIDAAGLDEDGTPSPVTPRWLGLRNLGIASGLLVAVTFGVSAAVRGDAKRDDVVNVANVANVANVERARGDEPKAAGPPERLSPVESGDRAPAASVAVADLPAAARSPRAAQASTLRAGTTNPKDKDSFREQLALVERARHSLSEGNPDACLATLRHYEEKYPSGLFMTEVRVVQVEALRAAGQTERAEALARELLAADPRGPYVDRLRSIFHQTNGLDQ